MSSGAGHLPVLHVAYPPLRRRLEASDPAVKGVQFIFFFQTTTPDKDFFWPPGPIPFSSPFLIRGSAAWRHEDDFVANLVVYFFFA